MQIIVVLRFIRQMFYLHQGNMQMDLIKLILNLAAPELRVMPGGGSFAFLLVQDSTVQNAINNSGINVWFSTDIANSDGGAQHFDAQFGTGDPPPGTDLPPQIDMFIEDLSSQPFQVPNARGFNFYDGDMDDNVFSFKPLRADIDADNNGTLLRSTSAGLSYADGYKHYLPGHDGEEFVLSTTDQFRQLSGDYQAQEIQIVIPGAGSDTDEFDSVEFEITDVTRYFGWTGNGSDPAVEGAANEEDVSFAEFGNQRTATGTIGSDRITVPVFVKDTAAHATIDVRFIRDGQVLLTHTIETSKDTDGDKMADSWEQIEIDKLNSQFGVGPGDFGYFGNISELTANKQTELADLDGPNNSDGGVNLPERISSGPKIDAFTAIQEYRGFKLDGGYEHQGGLTRFSPAYAEFIIEADFMSNLEIKIDDDGNGSEESHNVTNTLTDTMEKVVDGFNDPNDGAGIKAYYVVDEVAAEHIIPQGGTDQFSDYLFEHSSKRFKFQHPSEAGQYANRFAGLVVFGESAIRSDGTPAGGGMADTGNEGVYVLLSKKKEQFLNFFDGESKESLDTFTNMLARTSVHELIHTIVKAPNNSGPFGTQDHLVDPAYIDNVMYGLLKQNSDIIKISDPIRELIQPAFIRSVG